MELVVWGLVTFAPPQAIKTLVGNIISRKISTEEKRKLGAALTKLSPEDLTKALEIVAQNNPCFQATAEEVDLDMDAQVVIWISWSVLSGILSSRFLYDCLVSEAVIKCLVLIMQSESTLWRLKFFVKDALEAQGKSSASAGGVNNNNGNDNSNNNNNKRKREICDAIAKTAKKKNKKPSS